MTEPTGVSARRGPLRAGQRVQIKDAKGRLNTITLLPGGSSTATRACCGTTT